MKLTSKLLAGSQDVSAMAGAMKVLEIAFRVEIEPLVVPGEIEELIRARTRTRASGAVPTRDKRSTAA
jgi:hypothetical protein